MNLQIEKKKFKFAFHAEKIYTNLENKCILDP